MKHSIRVLMFSTAMVGLGSTANAAEMLENGGFERSDVTQPCCVTAPPAEIPGWTVEAGDTNVVNGTYNASPAGTNLAFEGNQYLDLVGNAVVDCDIMTDGRSTISPDTWTRTN